MKTLVINLFAGPGTGKSTTMAYIFSKLKYEGINCEMAPEYAKEVVWTDVNESKQLPGRLTDQIYIFGKQQNRIRRLNNKVQVVITDCPILLSLLYGKDKSDTFKQLVKETHNEFNNINIFLTRSKKYNPSGRLQNEEKAKELDSEIIDLLFENKIFTRVEYGTQEGGDNIVKLILETLK